MYKFPLRLPKDLQVIVSQPFRSAKPVDISKALSIETTDHNGLDIVCGTNEQTWGVECVWPFPWLGVVYDSRVSSQFGATDYARCQIDTKDPETGIEYSLIYLHLSSVTNTKTPTENRIVAYRQGEVVGKIGNNGSVRPSPTPERPLDGTHLHLGLGVKKPGEVNYTMVDPQIYLNVKDPFRIEVSAPIVISTAPVQEILPSARLVIVGNQLMASNPIQARIVLAVAAFLKAFNS